jgi:hypothetical protein
MTNEYSLVDLKAEARGHRRRLRLGRRALAFAQCRVLCQSDLVRALQPLDVTPTQLDWA